jgi:hypothetical protein
MQTAFASEERLKAIFDDFKYATTVEWDQKDPAFFNYHLSLFIKNLESLKQQGVTQNQMFEFLKKEIKNPQLRNDLDHMLSLYQVEQMDQSEAISFIRNSLEKSYAQGTSWSPIGNVLLITAGVIAILYGVAIIYMTTDWFNGNGGKNCYPEEVCKDNICTVQTVCR